MVSSSAKGVYAKQRMLALSPLGPEVFEPGEGPFRVRGLAYVGAMRYVDRHLPGGRSALSVVLGPYRAYTEQIFIAVGDYDVSPLVAVYLGAAELEGISAAEFIRARARGAAESDTTGVWRQLLRAKRLR